MSTSRRQRIIDKIVADRHLGTWTGSRSGVTNRGCCDTDLMEDRYWFDNSLSDEGDRLRLLEAIADPRSIRLLGEFDIEPGWKCAELGAGAGSMAMWLADQVGDRGSVLAVDRDGTLL